MPAASQWGQHLLCAERLKLHEHSTQIATEEGHVGVSVSPLARTANLAPLSPCSHFHYQCVLLAVHHSLFDLWQLKLLWSCGTDKRMCVSLFIHTPIWLKVFPWCYPVACHRFHCRKTPQRETTLAQTGFYTNASTCFPKKSPSSFMVTDNVQGWLFTNPVIH